MSVCLSVSICVTIYHFVYLFGCLFVCVRARTRSHVCEYEYKYRANLSNLLPVTIFVVGSWAVIGVNTTVMQPLNIEVRRIIFAT